MFKKQTWSWLLFDAKFRSLISLIQYDNRNRYSIEKKENVLVIPVYQIEVYASDMLIFPRVVSKIGSYRL